MRRPRVMMQSLFVMVAVVAVATWWFTDQPKRRRNAITAAKQAGGVVQLDQEYLPDKLWLIDRHLPVGWSFQPSRLILMPAGRTILKLIRGALERLLQ